MQKNKAPASKPGGRSNCVSGVPTGLPIRYSTVEAQESTITVNSDRGADTQKTGRELLTIWLRRRWTAPRLRALLEERFPGHHLPTATGGDFFHLIVRMALVLTPAFWRWIEGVPHREAGIPKKLIQAKGLLFEEAGWDPCPHNDEEEGRCDRCGGLGFFKRFEIEDARCDSCGFKLEDCPCVDAQDHLDARWEALDTERHERAAREGGAYVL